MSLTSNAHKFPKVSLRCGGDIEVQRCDLSVRFGVAEEGGWPERVAKALPPNTPPAKWLIVSGPLHQR